MAIINNQVVSKNWQAEFDHGRHPRGKIGFVLLATEQTIVDDMVRIIPKGIGVHFARVSSPDSITNASLCALAPDLTRAASTLLPDGSLDVITYACTSGSLLLGEGKVHHLLNVGAPSARASCIIAAVIRALHAIQAKKIVVMTPYLDEVNTAELKYLEDNSVQVIDFEGLNLEMDSDMVRVTPKFLREMALRIDRPEADAIFISCGALRAVDIIDELEQIIGKSIITSNQAMAWDVLRLAGIDDSISGYGRLLVDQTILHPLWR